MRPCASSPCTMGSMKTLRTSQSTAAPGTMPKPYRAAGIAKEMMSENMESLIDVLDTTEEQYTALLGSNYLDLRENPNDNLMDTSVCVLVASLVILVLYGGILLEERHERRKH